MPNHPSPQDPTEIFVVGADRIGTDLARSLGARSLNLADDLADFISDRHPRAALVIVGSALATATDSAALVERFLTTAPTSPIPRVILMSAFPDARRAESVDEQFEKQTRALKLLEVVVAASRLDWVVVRAGALRRTEGHGRVTAGPVIEHGSLSEDNLAAVVQEVTRRQDLVHAIVEVTDGPTPIADAIDAIVALRTPFVREAVR